MQRRRTGRRVAARSRPVELAVPQHDAFERRRAQGPVLERDDAADADAAAPFGRGVERILLAVRLGAGVGG